MYDFAAMWDWTGFAARWLHVVTAIAWVGSSFYFIALDLGLRKPLDPASTANGEEWQVHGGGFYHVQKYMVAPEAMPEHLTWFKWESYATWMSGALLLMIIYWAGADLYLIDPSVAALSTFEAILISAGSLTIGWLIYDFLCKSPLGNHPTALMLLLFILLVAMAWGYTQVFTGRASMVHLGAFTATIMSANVFFIIIPNQKIVVGDLKAGRAPDPKYGKIAKLRSTHNNYLTLPVLFLMLSNHYPLSFASQYNWAIAGLIFLMGVTIRHYFNTLHARKGNIFWLWIVTGILFVLVMWLSTAPMFHRFQDDAPKAALTPAQEKFAAAKDFAAVQDTVLGRCSMCHAREPSWEGMHWPPKGVRLETKRDIIINAQQIYLQAGLTNAMPPANRSHMEPAERRLIVAWYKDATGGA